MSDPSPENEATRSGEDHDLASREIELALPEWLADEYNDGDVIIPNVPKISTVEESNAEDRSIEFPAVAAAWIDPAATRILTERAALLALVASQTRGAGWGAEPPMLAPIEPAVTIESLGLDDEAGVPEEIEDHLPLSLVMAGLVLISVVVIAGFLIWYFELL